MYRFLTYRKRTFALAYLKKMQCSIYQKRLVSRVCRHPGSTPSQRQRRLYTSLTMAEEIDASRSSPRTESPTRPVLPVPSKVYDSST